jgi:hypothetical protein
MGKMRGACFKPYRCCGTGFAILTLVVVALGMVGLLTSRALGDRLQSALLWVILLLVGVVWLIASAALYVSDHVAWWWAGIACGVGLSGSHPDRSGARYAASCVTNLGCAGVSLCP